ncbi:6339_t:CDS:2 [Dentiscutata erythropus]|uniref:6339_t:CDS:1 n=1 Tax=Dentiscutata erythropus TaxID=1348616 RepID=A0A9N9DNY5_9GLOM|nr:6339_t:CDS:2 [Dentiscutata erythropus]
MKIRTHIGNTLGTRQQKNRISAIGNHKITDFFAADPQLDYEIADNSQSDYESESETEIMKELSQWE